jgi:chromosome segregation ATPase
MSRSNAQEAELQREALQTARALSEANANQQQLEADLQVARKRLERLEDEASRWAAEREALLVRGPSASLLASTRGRLVSLSNVLLSCCQRKLDHASEGTVCISSFYVARCVCFASFSLLSCLS